MKNNIQFLTDPDPSSSKSKAIYVVGPRGPRTKPKPLILRGQPLPWVSRANHLGHTLSDDGTEQILMVDKYCSAAYGSNLWKHTEVEARMYTNAWRSGHKIAWNVPRACWGYLLDTVLAPHVENHRASLLHRQVGFFHGLLRGPCKEGTVAALLASRDKQSTLGANLALIVELTGLDPWSFERPWPRQ